MQVSHDSFKAHSEPALAENPTNPRNLIAGSKFFTDPAHYRFKIGTYYSTDGGKSWHDAGLLPGFGSYATTSDVSIAFSSAGIAYVCVLAVSADGKRSGVFVSRSANGGKTFAPPVPVFLDTSGDTFSDKPWIAVDNSQGPFAGTIYVAWNLDSNTDSKGDPDAGDPGEALKPALQDAPVGMVVAHSTDGGRTFSDPVLISQFTSDQFAIGAIPAVGPRGRVYVVYSSIDRNGVVDELDMVSSTDGGVTFSAPRAIVPDVKGLPNHLSSGTFRNLTMPSFAISPTDGSLVVVWADMRNGDADVFATSSLDHGATWSPPTRINDDPLHNGKDQFMPEVAVAPNGTYTCAWFDRRRDPANRLIDEEIAQSSDDGRTFSKNVRVTVKAWNPAIDAPEPEGKKSNTFIGDYQALAVDNQTVHPLWNDTQDGRSQQIRTAVLSVRIFAQR